MPSNVIHPLRPLLLLPLIRLLFFLLLYFLVYLLSPSYSLSPPLRLFISFPSILSQSPSSFNVLIYSIRHPLLFHYILFHLFISSHELLISLYQFSPISFTCFFLSIPQTPPLEEFNCPRVARPQLPLHSPPKTTRSLKQM